MKDINFVNNFWDKENVGYKTIVDRINHSLATQQELLDYYHSRIEIEKEYTKKLEKLNQRQLGSHETGTLKKSLNKLNFENTEMVRYNQKFVKSVNQMNYGKLSNFYNMYHKRTKKILGHITKIVEKRNQTLKDLNMTKMTYKDNCSHIKTLNLAIQTTWGKELEQHEKKLAKLTQTVANSERNYKVAVDNFNKINQIFKRDWLISLKEVYQLEIERIQLLKVNCFNYCNNVATYCVDIDQSTDLARSLFAKVSPPQDLQDFSNNYGSGDQICGEYKFIDFMKGLDDENDYKLETAEFETPEFSHLLARSYSTYSHATQASQVTRGDSQSTQGTSPTRGSSIQTNQSPMQSPVHAPVPSMSPSQKYSTSPQKHSPFNPLSKLELPKPEDTKSSTSNQSPDEKTDVFSLKFNTSNSSSNYSNPTNYSGNSGHSGNGERTWSSPRRNDKHSVQERINLRSKELPNIQRTTSNPDVSKMPAMKDFSIDFIAKALEDLNQGGNGDIDQYRKSVRNSRHESKTAPNTPMVRRDDGDEIPTRYDSINFKSPKMKTTLEGSPRKARPKSMYDSFAYSEKPQDKPQRTLSKSPTKSYTNLYSIIDRITPVGRKPYLTKAVAKYSYSPQQLGELKFQKNWHIYIIHKQEDSWYLCELGDNCQDHRGEIGLVPGNYVVEGDNVF